MLIHAGNHENALHDAIWTLTGKDLEHTLRVLERLADQQEADWGRPELFVEVTLEPQGDERHTQYDMLLCFRDRIAHIEMKRGRLSTWRREETQTQMKKQLDSLRRRAVGAGLEEKNVVPILFLPHESRAVLGAVRTTRRAVQDNHVFEAGTDPEAFFLPTICMKALAKGIPSRPEGDHLARDISRAIRHSTWPTFSSLAHAKQYLSELPANIQEKIDTDRWHIRKLRVDEVLSGSSVLDGNGVVEVVGPPGSGRTAYVRDLAAQLNQSQGRGLLQWTVHQTRRPQDILRMIVLEVTGLDSSQGVDTLIARLAREPIIFWIQSYDSDSAEAVREIATRARAVHLNNQDSTLARWVFNSVGATVCPKECVLHLRPFAPTELFEILARAGEPGSPDRDPNEVIVQANGLPGLALRLWQSRATARPPRGANVYNVFEEQLDVHELKVLPFIALAGEASPLGMTVGMVRNWVAGAITSLPRRDAWIALDSVIKRLSEWGYLFVESAPANSLDVFGTEVQGGSDRPVLLTWRDMGFLQHILSRTGEEWHASRLTALQEYLLEQRQEDTSLGGVTIALQLGDLRPYVTSSFRHTHWRKFFKWTGRRSSDAFEGDPEQSALLRMLGLFAELSAPGGAPHLRLDDFDAIEPSTALTERMLTLLRARYRGSHEQDIRAIDSWREENEGNDDANVRSEVAVRIADAYRRCEAPQETLKCLLAARATSKGVTPATRGLVLFNVLASVNRRRLAGVEDLAGLDAKSLVVDVSSELAALAIQDENVVTLANAMFFLCRSRVEALAKGAPREALCERHVLEFVERVAPMRRVQALLTQASLHRHVCTNGHPTWSEFRERAFDAVTPLRRAHVSAIRQDSASHLLNATAYYLELFVLSLGFAKDPAARPDIIALASGAAAMAEETTVHLARLRIFPRDKELLLLPVQLHYPLSALLRECRYDLWADDIGERLRRPLAELQESFNTLARERPGRTEGRIKRSLRSYLLGLEAIRGMGAWRELKKAGVLNRLSVIAQGLAGRMRRDKAICKLCLELEQATHD